jgi:hypothetical protein
MSDRSGVTSGHITNSDPTGIWVWGYAMQLVRHHIVIGASNYLTPGAEFPPIFPWW